MGTAATLIVATCPVWTKPISSLGRYALTIIGASVGTIRSTSCPVLTT